MSGGAVAVLDEPELLAFRRPSGLDGFYVLSPFVTLRDGACEALLRLVNRDEDPAKKVSRIHLAASADGIIFEVGAEVVGPGKGDEPDSDGCEDPTVAYERSGYTAFYSGYNAQRRRSSMLTASGQTLDRLRKTGSAFATHDAYSNPKEAALVATPRGFRMFFEFARDGKSHIGVADAPGLRGPWTYADSPIVQRPDAFDSWHLSPCSAVRLADGTHMLFYNGGSNAPAWRISYALLDETATVVLERPPVPLIEPFGLEEGDTDIAFAASAPVAKSGEVWLYYSIADRTPYRSRLLVNGAVGDSAVLEAS